MPFCSKCGADVTGVRFCAKCGAPVEAGGGSAPGAGAPPPPAGSPGGSGGSYSGGQTDGGLSDNVAGALAYFTIIPAILFLIIEPFKNRRFVRFHAFQCLFLCVAAFVFWFGFGILSVVFASFGGSILVGMLSLVIQLGLFVVWLLLVIKAYQGQEFRLPVIGDLAAKQV